MPISVPYFDLRPKQNTPVISEEKSIFRMKSIFQCTSLNVLARTTVQGFTKTPGPWCNPGDSFEFYNNNRPLFFNKDWVADLRSAVEKAAVSYLMKFNKNEGVSWIEVGSSSDDPDRYPGRFTGYRGNQKTNKKSDLREWSLARIYSAEYHERG